MSDRRPAVFLVFAAACLALAPLAEPEHRWVCFAVAVVYVLLAIGYALDSFSRSRK